MAKQIAIIGAGISGLMACKHIMEKGFNPIVFEASNEIGGVWSSQTNSCTKLQAPKNYYQFTDFPWPPSINVTFPHHKQVMEYLKAYAAHFSIIDHIKFNTRVVGIEYHIYDCSNIDVEMDSWELWGGNGEPFSPRAKWKVHVQGAAHITEVYEVDFVILCIGNYSGLPFLPDFDVNEGPEIFHGKVLHSMDYAAMDDADAAKLVMDKRVVVVGFQKSALDITAEIARKNGTRYPCTLIFKTSHWTVPECLILMMCKLLTRFGELLVHKPREGFFLWLLALLLSPVLWMYSKLIETYLKWIYPLKKYNTIPDRGFYSEMGSCISAVLPADFYEKAEEGSLILKKTCCFHFDKSGLIVDGSSLDTDIVIFATGFRTDEKIKNVFQSMTFRKFITGSLAPFYRECIHPRIPQLAILGYANGPSVLYTTEMRTKWLSSFLAGKFKLPTIAEMEEDRVLWQRCIQDKVGDGYRKSCVSLFLTTYYNDLICKDMGCNPRRKKGLLAEFFAPYGPDDYKYL